MDPWIHGSVAGAAAKAAAEAAAGAAASAASAATVCTCCVIIVGARSAPQYLLDKVPGGVHSVAAATAAAPAADPWLHGSMDPYGHFYFVSA